MLPLKDNLSENCPSSKKFIVRRWKKSLRGKNVCAKLINWHYLQYWFNGRKYLCNPVIGRILLMGTLTRQWFLVQNVQSIGAINCIWFTRTWSTIVFDLLNFEPPSLFLLNHQWLVQKFKLLRQSLCFPIARKVDYLYGAIFVRALNYHVLALLLIVIHLAALIERHYSHRWKITFWLDSIPFFFLMRKKVLLLFLQPFWSSRGLLNSRIIIRCLFIFKGSLIFVIRWRFTRLRNRVCIFYFFLKIIIGNWLIGPISALIDSILAC